MPLLLIPIRPESVHFTEQKERKKDSEAWAVSCKQQMGEIWRECLLRLSIIASQLLLHLRATPNKRNLDFAKISQIFCIPKYIIEFQICKTLGDINRGTSLTWLL